MKKRNLFDKAGQFVLDRGFYLVLALGVVALALGGRALADRAALPAGEGGGSSVSLPEVPAVDPIPAPGERADVVIRPQEVEVPEREAQKPPEEQPESPPEAEKPKAPQPVSAVYTWPVKGEVLRDFSVEILSLDPTMGDWRTHSGVDIAASLGTKVLAMSAGTVERVYEDGLMGTTVVIDHGGGLTSLYANLEEVAAVEPGAKVETGSIIGKVGQTAMGESGLASHLHLEVALDGKRVDPLDYLPKLG